MKNDELPAVIVAPEYMGNKDQWCFWDEEFPEDRAYGPFTSKEATLLNVKAYVSWEENPPPVKVLDPADMKHRDDLEGRCYDYGCTHDCPIRRSSVGRP